jgi:urea carboxylase-associated protein 1
MKYELNVTVPAGSGWAGVVKKGQRFRIVDLEGNQAVDTLFYNAEDHSDRYSAVETIAAQRNIYLTTGSKLLTENGTVLMSIVADTCGRHDTLGGACSQESNMVRYDVEKRYMHACRQTFLKTGAAEGLTKRDLAPNVNFFMNVPVTPEGKLTFEDGISEPGKYVEMEAVTDTLVVISNCPQLNNPCNAYNPTPVRVLLWNP